MSPNLAEKPTSARGRRLPVQRVEGFSGLTALANDWFWLHDTLTEYRDAINLQEDKCGHPISQAAPPIKAFPSGGY